MKKYFVFISAILLLLVLASCASEQNDNFDTFSVSSGDVVFDAEVLESDTEDITETEGVGEQTGEHWSNDYK